MKRGDFVRVEHLGEHRRALVLLASPNGRSLALAIGAVLDEAAGTASYEGSLAVLLDDDGVYRELFSGEPVTIEVEQ